MTFLKKKTSNIGVGELSQWLRALAGLAEHLGLTSSTHNCLGPQL